MCMLLDLQPTQYSFLISHAHDLHVEQCVPVVG